MGLSEWYKLNFALMKCHNFSLTEIDGMHPYERDIYVQLLQDWMLEEKERFERAKRAQA